jgi:hypothetical protein
MILTSCPSCSRKLKLADNLAGKQIRCPACKHVFRVEAALAAEEAVVEAPAPAPAPAPVPAKARPAPAPAKPRPAPPPPPLEDNPFAVAEEPPARRATRRRPAAEPEPEGLDQPEAAEAADVELKQGRRAARSAAQSLQLAFLIDVLAYVVFVVLLIMGMSRARGGRDVPLDLIITVPLSILYLVPVIFLAVAGGVLSSLRARGLVITGCIMAFIVGVQLLVYMGFWGLVVAAALNVGVSVNQLVLPLILLFACVLGLVLSISAGIRGLITLGKPAVKAAYR